MADTAVNSNNVKVAFQGKPTRERATMGKLNAKARKALPADDFAGPDRSYPDEDKNHAEDALSRVSADGSPAVKAEVRKKVAKKFPNMKVSRLRKAGMISDRMHEKKTAKHDRDDGDHEYR